MVDECSFALETLVAELALMQHQILHLLLALALLRLRIANPIRLLVVACSRRASFSLGLALDLVLSLFLEPLLCLLCLQGYRPGL